MPKSKAIVLFSGGLDSLLAVRILQEQGLDVVGLTVETPFHHCEHVARPAAERLGIPLVVRPVDESYAEILRNPQWGFGKAMNPCIDCRIRMCRIGKQVMEEECASFIATGEVAGQRPNSQKEHQLNLISKQSGLQGRIVRPLCAKILAVTEPEREGLLDREKLYSFTGRGRSRLLKLAEELGVGDIPQPSTGCLLTEKTFVSRLYDLLKYSQDAPWWSFELLPIGRHLRIAPDAKAVVGRFEQENRDLERMAADAGAPESVFIYPENFMGPAVLWVGPVNDESIATSAALLLRFSKRFDPDNAIVQVTHEGVVRTMLAKGDEAVDGFRPL